jgi:pyrimidine-nucleoside phosphorylase
MQVVEVIRNKRDGIELPAEALKDFVEQYTRGDVPDYQMSAFLMAVMFRGMTPPELAAWTNAMLFSGEVVDFSDMPGVKVDKHSTGGVGDKVSLILAPLAVVAGLKVPMISGRGLGHTGGTVDKLESIPGFDMKLTTQRFREVIEEVGCGLIRQTGQIAPADHKLYALRDVTGTVRCIPLIASSIMSKKLAEGIDALVLDVKVGSGAFMRDIDEARELADTMIAIGEQMGKPVRAVITDMNQPLGRAVGNSLEVIESLEILKGGGPQDVIDVTLELVAHMLDIKGQMTDDSIEACKRRLDGYLKDGSALEALRKIIAIHNGDPRVCDDPEGVLGTAEHTLEWCAPRSGFITAMDTSDLGMAGVDIKGQRSKKEDEIDYVVGFIFHKKLGDEVTAGEPLVTIHYNDGSDVEMAQKRFARSITIADVAVPVPGLIKEVRGI